jgi:DNA-binding response OmpR family regulator
MGNLPMSDDLSDFLATRGPSPERPLLGQTVLVVEDSRYACEAIRLLCLRSGARIRRADCLRSARSHLQTYRPSVLIVDLGLPDGSGLDLIRDVTAMLPSIPAVLGTSGDSDRAAEARAAGAGGFLTKPVESLAAFQAAVLAALHDRTVTRLVGTDEQDRVVPDPLALRDDLSQVANALADTPDDTQLDYIAQFLSGLARSAHDEALVEAASSLALHRRTGGSTTRDLSRLTGLVQARLETGVAF